MYQDKDNFEKQISIVKGTEKFFLEKVENYSEKVFIWLNSPFSRCFFLKKKSKVNIFPKKNRKIYSTQYPAKQPYYQFVN